MPVNSLHQEYKRYSQIWDIIEDFIDGQESVKSKKEKYLPKLGGQGDLEYQAYLQRASFQNLAGRTLDVALGQIFRKPPQYRGIDDAVIENINLAESHINYFCRDIAEDLITKNRVGIWLDYSDEQGRPYLKEFDAESIINWQEQIIRGIKQLSRVVIAGCQYTDDPADPFVKKEKKIWTELYLEDDKFIVRDWELYQAENGQTDYRVIDGSERMPIMNDKPLNFIPFYFVTSKGITTDLDIPTINDLVNINRGHYINYADYENMLHWTGAKTVIATHWPKNVPFPIGGAATFEGEGDAKFLEATSDSGLITEIRHKEEQAAAMGSQILSGQGRYVQSADTSKTQSSGEYATIADISNAMGYAMTQIMKIFVQWGGGNPDDVSAEFNTDYETANIPQGFLTELTGALQTGNISPEVFYYQCSQYEIYPPGHTFEKEQKLKDAQAKKAIEDRQKKIDASIVQNMQSQQQTPMNEPSQNNQ